MPEVDDELDLEPAEDLKGQFLNKLDAVKSGYSEEAYECAKQYLEAAYEEDWFEDEYSICVDNLWEYVSVEEPFEWLSNCGITNFRAAIDDGECYDIYAIADYYLRDEVWKLLQDIGLELC